MKWHFVESMEFSAEWIVYVHTALEGSFVNKQKGVVSV
jgi:hypothetical protein